MRATLAVSPTWDGAAESERALADLASWGGGPGTRDDRLRVVGICLHYGGDPEVAHLLHAAQLYTGWAGFVESSNDREAYATQARLAASLGLRVKHARHTLAGRRARGLGGDRGRDAAGAAALGARSPQTTPRHRSSSASAGSA